MALASLLKPLALQPAAARKRPRLGARVRIFAAARNELLQAFANTATAGSIITTQALGLSVKDFQALSSYLPKDPVVSRPESLANAGLHVPAEALTALSHFHASMEDAKRSTSAAERQSRLATLDPRGWLAASLRWRKASADAIAAYEAFDRVGRQAGFFIQADGTRIVEVLRRVRDGEAPCVGPDGAVFVPRVSDRRREFRKVINQPAWHQVGEARYPVTVADISTTGICVVGCTSAIQGDRLAIELNCSRLLFATVIWVEGYRVGARLLDPLTPNDILLRDR